MPTPLAMFAAITMTLSMLSGCEGSGFGGRDGALTAQDAAQAEASSKTTRTSEAPSDAPADSAKDEAPAEKGPLTDEQRAGKAPTLPGVTLNLEQRYIDLDAEITLTEGLLELVATLPAGKEHESLVAIKARPKHVHLALLLLGLRHGHPGSWKYENDKVIPIDPVGDPVELYLVVTKDGEAVEKPIGEFIINKQTNKTMAENHFVFAGSRIVDPGDGEPFYAADHTGDIITLVSFDSEVIALPSAASNSNEEVFWVVNKDTVPELGTKVKLRLRPGKKAEAKPEAPQP